MREYNGINVDAYNDSRDWKIVSQVIQYLNTFKCCEGLIELLKEWVLEVRAEERAARQGTMLPSRPPVMPREPKKCCGDEKGKGGAIVADGGIVFNQSPFVCPECGEGVLQSIFCEKMKENNPDIGASGMFVCSRHPLVSKQDPCFYEVYLPPVKKGGKTNGQ